MQEAVSYGNYGSSLQCWISSLSEIHIQGQTVCPYGVWSDSCQLIFFSSPFFSDHTSRAPLLHSTANSMAHFENDLCGSLGSLERR